MKKKPQRFIIFSLHGTDYALDLQNVAEVKEPPQAFPIPRAPAHFIGMMNFHGALVPVLDLALYANAGTYAPTGKVLVLDSRIATLALWVDGIKTIVPVEALASEQPGIDGLTEKILLFGESEVRLLALESLLHNLETSLNI